MAKPTTRSWTKLSIWPGDGGSPEDFAQKVCGLTSKGFTLSSDVAETNVPDCDDPDLPGWVERTTRSNSADLSGSGVMAEENFDFYRQWKMSGEEKNTRVVLDLAGFKGGFQRDRQHRNAQGQQRMFGDFPPCLLIHAAGNPDVRHPVVCKKPQQVQRPGFGQIDQHVCIGDENHGSLWIHPTSFLHRATCSRASSSPTPRISANRERVIRWSS